MVLAAASMGLLQTMDMSREQPDVTRGDEFQCPFGILDDKSVLFVNLESGAYFSLAIGNFFAHGGTLNSMHVES